MKDSKEKEVVSALGTTSGTSLNGNYYPHQLGFDIDCTSGYKDKLRSAASGFVGRLLAGVNREGSPLDLTEREASTTRLNLRGQKQVRLINALPDTLPARAVDMSTGVPEEVLAQLILLVDSSDRIDMLFEVMPGVPLVLQRFGLDNGRERSSIGIAQLAQGRLGSRPDGHLLTSSAPIAPFFWRHRVYGENSWTTSVIWYAQLADEEGLFLAQLRVDVLNDTAHVITESSTSSPPGEGVGRTGGSADNDGNDGREVGEASTMNLRMRLVDAPQGEFITWIEIPELCKGRYEMYWPRGVQRPADVFGRVEELGSRGVGRRS